MSKCDDAETIDLVTGATTSRKAKRGLAALCFGGGEAVALLIERP